MRILLTNPRLAAALFGAVCALTAPAVHSGEGYPSASPDAGPSELAERDPFDRPGDEAVRALQTALAAALEAETLPDDLRVSSSWSTVRASGLSQRTVTVDGWGRVTMLADDVPELVCSPVPTDAVRAVLRLALDVDPAGAENDASIAIALGGQTAVFGLGPESSRLAWAFEELAFRNACGPARWIPGDATCWVLGSESGNVAAQCEPDMNGRPCWGTGVHGATAEYGWRRSDCGADVVTRQPETWPGELPVGGFSVDGTPHWDPAESNPR